MELELSDDRQFFVETVRRFLSNECSIGATRALEHDPAGFDRDVWMRGAALGWTSMLVAEADGGGRLSEHGLLDLVLVAEEMGRVVAPGPLGPVNLVAAALARAGTPSQRAEVLPGLVSGEAVAAWCGPTPVGTSERGSAVVLDGTMAPVEAGAQSRHLLVAARHRDGLSQVLLPADAPGVTVTPMAGLDLVRRFARVRFDAVALPAGAVVGAAGGAAGDIEALFRLACVIQCAEMVGAMDRVLEMTIGYLGDRHTFGRPLASYQALKHRVADDKVALESCHAVAAAATRAVASGADDAGELVSAAKAWIGPQATELVQDCVQLHGGIGVTWDHDLHLYLRRVTVDRVTHGTPEEHVERIAAGLLGAA